MSSKKQQHMFSGKRPAEIRPRDRRAAAILDDSPIILDRKAIPFLVQSAMGSEYFQEESMAPDPSYSHQARQNVSAEFFGFTRKLQQEGSIASAIRKRLCYVIYYKSKLLWQDMGSSGDIVHILSHLIKRSGICELEQAEIEKILRGWVERGERYDLLADDLGGLGVLFLLPADKESLWCTHLPKGRTTKKEPRRSLARDSVIKALLSREIHLEAARIHAHKIARELVNYYVGRIYTSVQSEYCQLQQSWTLQCQISPRSATNIQHAENQEEENGRTISDSNRGIMQKDQDATTLGYDRQANSCQLTRHVLSLEVDQTQVHGGITPSKRKIAHDGSLSLEGPGKRQRSSIYLCGQPNNCMSQSQGISTSKHSQELSRTVLNPTPRDNSREKTLVCGEEITEQLETVQPVGTNMDTLHKRKRIEFQAPRSAINRSPEGSGINSVATLNNTLPAQLSLDRTQYQNNNLRSQQSVLVPPARQHQQAVLLPTAGDHAPTANTVLPRVDELFDISTLTPTYLARPSRHTDHFVSSIDFTENHLQSKGAIDSAVTIKSPPQIPDHAGLNGLMDRPTELERPCLRQGFEHPNENPKPAYPLERSQCLDEPLHNLFYTPLADPRDTDLVTPALGGSQHSEVPLHSLFTTQLEYPSGNPEPLGLEEKQNTEVSLHSLFSTQLDYPCGNPESVVFGLEKKQHAETSLHNLFNTQLEYPDGNQQSVILGLEGKQHAETSLHNLFNTQPEYRDENLESAEPGSKATQNLEASLYSLYDQVEITSDPLAAFHGNRPEDVYI